MPAYQLKPGPDVRREEYRAQMVNLFSAAEMEKIIVTGEDLVPGPGAIASGNDRPEIRNSRVSWIEQTPDTGWIFDKLAYAVTLLNTQYFGFDLYGFSERLQYTVYDGPGTHYGWHVDKAYNQSASPRKLSASLQLSDPTEYEGGDLELFVDEKPEALSREHGMLHLFPSWTLHRVTPITWGTRRSLVIWTAGHPFK